MIWEIREDGEKKVTLRALDLQAKNLIIWGIWELMKIDITHHIIKHVKQTLKITKIFSDIFWKIRIVYSSNKRIYTREDVDGYSISKS